jgi:hypothetical protein
MMGYIPPSPATRDGETQSRYPATDGDGPGFLGFLLRVPLLFFFLGYLIGALFRFITQ